METDSTPATANTGLGYPSKLIYSAFLHSLKGMPRGAAWLSAALRSVIDPIRSWKDSSHEWELVSALIKEYQLSDLPATGLRTSSWYTCRMNDHKKMQQQQKIHIWPEKARVKIKNREEQESVSPCQSWKHETHLAETLSCCRKVLYEILYKKNQRLTLL